MQIRIPVVFAQECATPVVDIKLSPLRGHEHKKRCYTMPKVHLQGSSFKYDTIDNNRRDITSARSKRISSAAVAKKFPKDFFKNQKCLQPIRSSRSNSNNQYINFIDTFSHKIFAVNPIKDQKQLKDQKDTPKFQGKAHQKYPLGQTLRNKISSLIKQKPLDRYLRQQTREKCPILQIKQFQQLESKFGIKPFQVISQNSFNITLGKKISQSIMAQKNHQKKQAEQKENKESKTTQDSKRQVKYNMQGFKIRKRTQML